MLKQIVVGGLKAALVGSMAMLLAVAIVKAIRSDELAPVIKGHWRELRPPDFD